MIIMKTELVFLGHDNSIDLILKADGVAVDMTPATLMTITIGGVTITSDNGDADPIRWNKAGYDVGEVRLFLGSEAIIPGHYRATLVVYDTTNTDGVVWENAGLFIPMEVKAEVEAAP